MSEESFRDIDEDGSATCTTCERRVVFEDGPGIVRCECGVRVILGSEGAR